MVSVAYLECQMEIAHWLKGVKSCIEPVFPKASEPTENRVISCFPFKPRLVNVLVSFNCQLGVSWVIREEHLKELSRSSWPVVGLGGAI